MAAPEFEVETVRRAIRRINNPKEKSARAKERIRQMDGWYLNERDGHYYATFVGKSK